MTDLSIDNFHVPAFDLLGPAQFTAVTLGCALLGEDSALTANPALDDLADLNMAVWEFQHDDYERVLDIAATHLTDLDDAEAEVSIAAAEWPDLLAEHEDHAVTGAVWWIASIDPFQWGPLAWLPGKLVRSVTFEDPIVLDEVTPKTVRLLWPGPIVTRRKP